MTSKVRNQISRAKKQGLTVTELNDENEMSEYVKLRQSSRVENGLKPLPDGLLERQIRQLSETTRVFVVKHEGDTVSGQIIQSGVNIFTLTGVCTSKIAYERKLNANDLMQYSVVLLAIQQGVRFIDWAGAQPKSTDKKMNSIDSFKRKWGGELVELPCILKGYSS